MAEALIGVIGGTGLYQIEGLTDTQETIIDTPFGAPSDAIVTGVLNGVGVAFLPRHGRGHRLMPSEIPSRANIYALKSLGVERAISVSAVGSLRENIRPLDMIVPDQLIDRTVGRPGTFFGDGLIAHVGMADPFCPEMRDILYNSASEMGARAHPSGTLVIINGPQFSTRAESHMYRSWGADIIGMTALPEAKLAREAEMCYSILACSTDYDCWHESAEPVTVEMVVENLMRNTALSKAILADVITRVGPGRGLLLRLRSGECHCDRQCSGHAGSQSQAGHSGKQVHYLILNSRRCFSMARQDPGEPYFRVSLDEAKSMLDGGNAVVIDVRRPDEWAEGHVQGATHIPVDDVLARIDELPQGMDLLFICAQGVRSGLACEMAAAMNFETEQLFNIEEGTAAWIEKGLPAERG